MSLILRIRSCLLGTMFLLSQGELRAGPKFQAAMVQYTKGNFKTAVSGFETALGEASAGAEKGRTLKFLGISQFMVGQKDQAAQSFQRALTEDASIVIGEDEVLDESVLVLFEQQRGRVASSAEPPGRVGAGRGSGSSSGVGKAKATRLQVTTNVRGAAILLDGILVGKSGETFEVDPGSVEIEVQASGYHTKKVSTQVKKNRVNTAHVQLQKQAPPSAAKAAVGGAVAVGGRSAPGRGSKKAAPAAAVDDIFLPDPKGSKAPRRTAPSSTGGRNLADEFAKDAASGGMTAVQPRPAPAPSSPMQSVPPPMMPAPQAIYPQQPSYPAPGYVPAPQPYGATPYGYGMPPYGAYPPAVGPAYPTYNVPYPQQGYQPYAPPLPPAPPPSSLRSPNPTRELRPKRKPTSIPVALLPLGAGQFYNRDYLLGGVFMAGQVGCGIGWFLRYQESQRFLAEANNSIQASSTDPDVTQEDLERYRVESAAYVDSVETESYIWLGAALGLWAVSSVQAIVVGRDMTVAARGETREEALADVPRSTGVGTPARPLAPQWDLHLGLLSDGSGSSGSTVAFAPNSVAPVRSPPRLALGVRLSW